MKKVITYGTFDLFHEGHRSLLERAKALGDYLIVGVTSDTYDRERGKLNVKDSLEVRIGSVKASGYADEVIIEGYLGQKVSDIAEHKVDIFAIGNDWKGKFDYLSKYCEVIYLERTKGVSSSQLREDGAKLLRLGIVSDSLDDGGICSQAYFVSGLEFTGVYVPADGIADDDICAEAFREKYDLAKAFESADDLHEWNGVVYIHTGRSRRFEFAMGALKAGCHVICDMPLGNEEETEGLRGVANERGLLFVEYTPIAYLLSETARTISERGDLL
ncbi:MAG: adenylyltransferase/cytidyltransferase family protein [Clostridiales bacterium]|nr:adenylyltransferase/cytidyltransferase family protein [Clostridiales bacterium]